MHLCLCALFCLSFLSVGKYTLKFVSVCSICLFYKSFLSIGKYTITFVWSFLFVFSIRRQVSQSPFCLCLCSFYTQRNVSENVEGHWRSDVKNKLSKNYPLLLLTAPSNDKSTRSRRTKVQSFELGITKLVKYKWQNNIGETNLIKQYWLDKIGERNLVKKNIGKTKLINRNWWNKIVKPNFGETKLLKRILVKQNC